MTDDQRKILSETSDLIRDFTKRRGVGKYRYLIRINQNIDYLITSLAPNSDVRLKYEHNEQRIEVEIYRICDTIFDFRKQIIYISSEMLEQIVNSFLAVGNLKHSYFKYVLEATFYSLKETFKTISSELT